jgi:hypothetical protein
LRRAFTLRAGGAAAAACLAGFAGCSLGLDEGLLTAIEDDAGSTSDAPIEAAVGDVLASDASSDVASDAAPCAKDVDCKSSDACLVGRCDLALHACVYDTCPTNACQASYCDRASHTCSAPTTYGFHAAAIRVTVGAVGCGGVASRCLAAVAPFVFVGTSNGVIAYVITEPSNPAPAAAPVTGLPFLPAWILGNGRRVYFVGGVVGAGPTYRLPLAWIDVPTDPKTTPLVVHTVLQSYGQPTVSMAFVGGGGSLFLEYADAQKAYPAAFLTAPLQDLDAVRLFPSPGIPVNAAPLAASGSRLVVYRWANDGGALTAYFSFETNAGTANAQNAGEQPQFKEMGPTYSQPVLAAGPDGSLLWSTPSVVVNDGGEPVIRAARMAWLVADQNATKLDATVHVDVETYQPALPWGSNVAGPMAWLDAKTALALAAAPGVQNQTSVQVATNSPTPAIIGGGRRYVVPVNTTQVGAAASNGLGFVLAADANDAATLHVFAPACATP